MLPQDPAILLSCVNTWLRDEYDSLDSLCGSLGISPAKLAEKLAGAGYVYDEKSNQFRTI